MKSINIAVFEDHPLVQNSLKGLLSEENGFQLKFIASNKSDLFELLNETPQLDILVADYLANDVSGMEVYEFVIRNYPQVKVVALTSLSSPILIENLIRLGVKGYINKNQEVEELLQALKVVAEDKLYLPPEFDSIYKKLKSFHTKPAVLTPRELEVVNYIAREFTTNDIAEFLNITVNSVETHRKNIFLKLHVKNVAGMIREAMQLGLIS